MVKLGVAHVNLTIFAFQTEIMRTAAIAITMPAMSTMAAGPDAVTLVNAMTLLTAPVTFIQQCIRVSSSQGANGLSHDPNFVLGEGESGG